MVGTSFDTMGGISSVVKGYASEGFLDRCAIRYIVMHRDGRRGQKLATAIRGMSRLLWICLTERKLLVHIHMSSRASFWRKSLCCLICLMLRHPYLIHMHGSEFMIFYERECGALAKRFVRFILSRAACLIALSESWRDNLRSLAPAARIEVVPNAVPMFVHGAPAPNARRAVLFLGRLGARKGVDDLIQAFADVADEFPDVEVVCGGDGEVEATQNRARALGLESRVTCPGWLRGEAKQAVLERSVVFALPSHAEGLPMALLEAMAAGLPVLATSVGGIPEVVRHGIEGYLIDPGDIAALRRWLRELLHDDAKREELARNARRRIEERYALPRVIERLESIYESVA